jgi:hypothetical protein
VPKPRAVGLLPVCPTVKPVGEPDALIGHVRFDERGCETERCRMAEATALILDSTGPDFAVLRCLRTVKGADHADFNLGVCEFGGMSRREFSPRRFPVQRRDGSRRLFR